ncbi:brefeldin A resistance protein-like [Dorcoceras hygrometricum]|uniref:Brefeldin A resistance protein-like n=1 Tax=Dorcoceras hygrometricum TaxID=472368 RepID=A0A2Z7BIJ2_9LAMI|nr:brefeldin A resistance protein-like [Dorcoceras hygrometricum]
MGDAENNIQPSKKRAAGVQLSRDNPGLDDSEDTCENEEGTFRKASDEVLATRRIVKVRRHQTSSTPSGPDPTPASASNPFAAIRLVPPASSAPPVKIEECHITIEQNEEIVNTDSNNANVSNEPKVESNPEECSITSEQAEENVKTDTDNVQESDEPKLESNLKEEKTSVNVGDNSQQSEVESENSGDGVKNTAESYNTENEVKKDIGSVRNYEEKANGEATLEKNSETASFSSFQNLSSGQNAFSGFSRKGFAGTAFSFGSTPKDGSLNAFSGFSGKGFAGTAFSFGSTPKDGSLNAFSGFSKKGFAGTAFSFGSIPKDGSLSCSTTGSLLGLKNDHGFGVSHNGNTSLFGTFGSNTTDKSESSKSASMPEVPVETGEENEETVFTAYSVLFEFVAGVWKERGKGELKINVPTIGTGKPRLVMRARGNYRLILNANLFPELKLTSMDKKGITFACVNSAGEGKDGLSTIALKFKDASTVEDFQTAVTFHKDSTNVSLKTPENSP